MAISDEDFKDLQKMVMDLQKTVAVQETTIAVEKKTTEIQEKTTTQHGDDLRKVQNSTNDLQKTVTEQKGRLTTHAIVAGVLAGLFGLGGGALFVKVASSAADLTVQQTTAIATVDQKKKEAVEAVGDREKEAARAVGAHERTSLAAVDAEGSRQVSLIEKMAADELRKLRAFEAPVGTVAAWPSDAAIPADWRVCDGSSVDFNEDLWKVLKGSNGEPRYGNADAERVAKILLPDFRGYFLRGADNGRGIDPARKTGTIQDDQLQDHHHIMEMTDTHFDGSPDSKPSAFMMRTGGQKNERTPVTSAVQREGGGRAGDETRPKNIAVNWIIRIGSQTAAVEAATKSSSRTPVDGDKK